MSTRDRYMIVVASVCALVWILQANLRSGDGVAADSRSSQVEAATFTATKSSTDHRITILGITKGMSLLNSNQLVSDGGREHGENVVRWIRIAVLAENVSRAPLAFEAEAADGRPLVEKTTVEVGGKRVGSQSCTRKSLPVDVAGLEHLVFPVVPPEASDPGDSRIFIFTLSGNLQQSETATMRFRFGEKDESAQSIVFEDVPMP